MYELHTRIEIPEEKTQVAILIVNKDPMQFDPYVRVEDDTRSESIDLWEMGDFPKTLAAILPYLIKGSNKVEEAFLKAAELNEFEFLKTLRPKVSDINFGGAHQYTTALYNAIVHGNMEMIRYLRAEGATIHGIEALHQAAEKGSIDIAQYLLEQGADINELDILKRTPLHAAANWNQSAMIAFLLQQKNCLVLTDSQRRTPDYYTQSAEDKALIIAHREKTNKRVYPEGNYSIPGRLFRVNTKHLEVIHEEEKNNLFQNT